jgi:hypothetical protein
MTTLPPWARAADPDDDTDRYAAMTPADRLQLFEQACELARSILAQRPDAEAVLARRVPLSPESEALWLRLVKEARRG